MRPLLITPVQPMQCESSENTAARTAEPSRAITLREIPPEHRLRLVDLDAQGCGGRHHFAKLSRREREVFFHMIAGKTMREAADAMRVRPRTVEKHRSRVLRKIDARNAVEAVHFAVSSGLLVVPEQRRKDE